jgi:DNA-binding NarL/FixJ family response regulator
MGSVEIAGLTKRYGDKVAVDNLSFTVPPGRRLIDAFAGFLPDPAIGRSPAQQQLSQLTDREREVMAQVVRGLSNSEIAQVFTVSEATVKTHVGRILNKLGLRDRVQVVVFAYEAGMIRPGNT